MIGFTIVNFYGHFVLILINSFVIFDIHFVQQADEIEYEAPGPSFLQPATFKVGLLPL